MRLPEDKIKQAILHPDPKVREMAVRYFSESFSPDPTIMPLVIQAVEKYGSEDFSALSVWHGLPQTDETLQWILAELAAQVPPKNEDRGGYYWGLLHLLMQADAHLLARHQTAIMAIKALDHDDREAIRERIDLLSADPEACWTALEDFCDRERKKRYVTDVNLGPANRLVEAIARHGERYAERVLSILAEEIEDFTDHPMGWLEPLAVRLAGEMKLEPAIPLIVEKLHEEGDYLHEECQLALWKIGNEAVVEAVSADYFQSDWSYRLYVAAVLERIHCDLTVTKTLEFLPQEKDDDLRVWLGRVLLRQFSTEGVETIRQLILRGPLDPEMRSLRQDFLTACTLMEVSIPEADQWRKDAKHDIEANKRFYRQKHPALAEFRDKLESQAMEEDDFEEPPPVRRKVGRNEPCPCGSGKKFKRCCLGKKGTGFDDQ